MVLGVIWLAIRVVCVSELVYNVPVFSPMSDIFSYTAATKTRLAQENNNQTNAVASSAAGLQSHQHDAARVADKFGRGCRIQKRKTSLD